MSEYLPSKYRAKLLTVGGVSLKNFFKLRQGIFRLFSICLAGI